MGRALSVGKLAPIIAAAVLVSISGAAIAKGHVRPQSGKDVGWTMVDENLEGWRYSPLTQVNVSNVKHLKVAWKFIANVPGANEDHPIIIGNVAYVSTAFNHVFALNATTGQEIWSFVPKEGLEVACCGPDARGLAYHDGTLYMVTLDDQFIALNAKTGTVKWDVKVASAKAGYAETASPLYYKGMILIGSSGSELGVRGFEEARSAATGKLIWQFYTVPPRSQSWVKLNGGIAGGTVWNNPVIDPNTNILYIGTANPAPLLYGLDRPGPDHWTDSVVALNASTGKMVWAFSTTPHDLWDYDNSSNPILFPTQIGMGVGEAGKSGMWNEFLASNGEELTTPVPFVMANHALMPSIGKHAKPVTVSPSPLGGDSWSPTAYDPQTGYVYIDGNNSTVELTGSPKGDKFKNGKDDTYIGSTFSNLKSHGSNITAIDVGSGTIAWQYKMPLEAQGGPTTTAGGLVFGANSETGKFFALNAKTGQLLWETDAPGPIGGGASVYMVNGKEYILVPLGGAGDAGGIGKLAKAPTGFICYTLGG
jgi:alcohol dehydrogenase (cytochrome c)